MAGETLNDQRRNELILAPNEFAYISDETKGNVDIYSGPHKTSLAASDQPVIFSAKSKRFERVDLKAAIQPIVVAPEGWYITLKNPSKDKDKPHPRGASRESMPALDVGRKVIIPGPASFPLWPAQMAKVLPGHTLRSNQYLLVRVYDEDAARINWKSAVIKKVDGETAQIDAIPELSMGKLLVIKGTEVSFYIPPTGVEVVSDEAGKLIREAVTLERLEYCLLLDENGNKRYVQGPDVVFPRPTEVWVTRTTSKQGETPRSTRKFKAIELSETSGIYVKVIADYKDEADHEWHVGDEDFITGKKQKIYFPREEHAIIKYGDQDVHYATAIPAGEGRYVLNRLTGQDRLIEGPAMFLPDPRTEVILRRVLDLKTCALLYPNNEEALAVNAALLGIDLNAIKEVKTRGGVIGTGGISGNVSGVGGVYGVGTAPAAAAYYVQSAGVVADALMLSNNAEARGLGGTAREGFTGDRFQRKDTYTEPRTITLNTKYVGAVTTNIWTGYALMLVSKNGDRRVVQGPKTVMLGYNEEPQKLTLSTGKPKTTDTLYETFFLRTHANMVSDIIEVETKDFCKLNVKVSYRVNFEGDPMKWFSVENYVKFLADHMRSKIRNAVRKFGVEEFYTGSEAVLRDIILGKATDGKRPGTSFEENGMYLYDVEVLAVSMQNTEIEKLLVGSQRETMNHALQLASSNRSLEFTTENEKLKQLSLQAQAITREVDLRLKTDELNQKLSFDLATLEAGKKTDAERLAVAESREKGETLIHDIKLARQKSDQEVQLEFGDRQLNQRLRELEAEVEAVVKRGGAITPDLIQALATFGERESLIAISKSMAPLSILGGEGKSVVEIFADLLKGTPIAKHLLPAGSNGNGASKTPQASA